MNSFIFKKSFLTIFLIFIGTGFIYLAASGQGTKESLKSPTPSITNAFLDKYKYYPNDIMTITAETKDALDIKASVENETGFHEVSLAAIASFNDKQTWTGQWKVADSIVGKVYKLKIIASNRSETVETVLEWEDPSNPGHPASSVDPGTFGTGADTYTFAGTLKTSGFQLGTSATAGQVLTTSASGIGTWQAIPGGVSLSGTNTWTGAQTFSANTNFPGSGIWNTSGNVGIGTASPGYKLDVNGNIGTNYGSVVLNPNGGTVGTDGTYGIYWHQGSGVPSPDYGIYRTAGAWTPSTYQQLKMSFATGIIIDGGTLYNKSGTILQPNGGNVGIGTTVPGAKLEVAGQIKITGGTPGAGKVLTSDASGLATWQSATSGASGVKKFILTSGFNAKTGNQLCIDNGYDFALAASNEVTSYTGCESCNRSGLPGCGGGITNYETNTTTFYETCRVGTPTYGSEFCGGGCYWGYNHCAMRVTLICAKSNP